MIRDFSAHRKASSNSNWLPSGRPASAALAMPRSRAAEGGGGEQGEPPRAGIRDVLGQCPLWFRRWAGTKFHGQATGQFEAVFTSAGRGGGWGVGSDPSHPSRQTLDGFSAGMQRAGRVPPVRGFQERLRASPPRSVTLPAPATTSTYKLDIPPGQQGSNPNSARPKPHL